MVGLLGALRVPRAVTSVRPQLLKNPRSINTEVMLVTNNGTVSIGRTVLARLNMLPTMNNGINVSVRHRY